MRDFGIPEVVGDPAGMRALAARLRGDADTVDSLTRRAEHQVEGAKMRGPAAERLRGRARSFGGTSGSVSNRLRELAAFLEHEAADVERRRRDRANLLERLMDEARRAAGR